MAGRKRSRRAKYITLYSPFLMKETKHELIGEPIETEKGRHQWARCTRSRHSQLVNLDSIEADSDRSKAVVHISREDARKYSPGDEYQIGDVIFHSKWDDVGIVRSKEVTSTGGKSIIVHFEKNNEKRLIENLQ
ncbi:MAG: hypothetical protein HW421_959 [Ignavibacteria bacterium]|nr:hypothetical protein [Ignavibacteria bacterium]